MMLESNRFAPVTGEEDFLKRVYLAGDEILEDLRSSDPKLPTEIRGFAAEMDLRGDWEPVPIQVGLVEAGGPLDHAFFTASLLEIGNRLSTAGPLDAVYICNHGAMITTEEADPDGEIFTTVRRIVGPEVPVIATLDLHGNVSERMVDSVDAIIAYQTNPHVDMLDRGREAAGMLHELLAGLRPEVAFIRLPIDTRDDIHQEPIFDQGVDILVPEGHPLASRDRVHWTDLSGERFLVTLELLFGVGYGILGRLTGCRGFVERSLGAAVRIACRLVLRFGSIVDVSRLRHVSCCI